jgi:hypothetical protein
MEVPWLCIGGLLATTCILLYNKGQAMFNKWRDSRVEIKELELQTAEQQRLAAEAAERAAQLRREPHDEEPDEPHDSVR